LIEITMRHWI